MMVDGMSDSYSDIQNMRRRFKRCCTAINNILYDAKKIWPNATLYLDGTENLHLMSSESHDDHDKPQQHNIIVTGKLEAAGGDW
jgi:hypothetical protein